MLKNLCRLGHRYNRPACEMIDPDRRHLWGMKRAIIDVIVAGDMFVADRIATGDTDGVSVGDQLRHKFEEMDVSEQNSLQDFKEKLRQEQE